MPRLSTNERHRAMGLLEGGVGVRQVARIMGCNPTTIVNLRRRHQETGSMDNRPRPGRERVTTPGQDWRIVLQHLRDRFRTAVQTASETRGRHQDHISSNTVRRRLRARGIRAQRPAVCNVLNDIRRQNRLDWARRHLNWTQVRWNTTVFSDESRFCVYHHDGRQRVWRRRGEQYAQCCILQHDRWGGPSVMVWAGISANYRTPLVIIRGNLTAARYINEVLQPTLIPFLTTHPAIQTFQQDNARPHTARVMAGFLERNHVDVLPWPAYSPDLSPIEHLWDQLGRRIARRDPRPGNRDQLVAALQEEWANIPQDNIRRLVRSMRRRCTACINARGGHTPY